MKPRGVRTLVLAAFLWQTAIAAQSLPEVSDRLELIPQDALISLELSRPRALLDLLAGDKTIEAIKKLPVYQRQMSNPKFNEFLNLVRFLEAALGTDWRTGLAKLTGGGVTFAVCPEDTVLLIIDAEDERMLEQIHETFLNIARSEAEKKGRGGSVASTQFQGVTAWTFDGKEAHAIIGRRLILANRPEGLKAILEMRARNGGASLASKPAYRAATKQAGSDPVAAAFVDLKPIMQIPDVARLLKGQNENPLAALAFAGIAEAVRGSNWLGLGLYIKENNVIVRASVDGKTIDRTSVAAFALPKGPGEGILPNLLVPRRVAALTLYRDLHQFYAAKDDLFPERTSGLIFFENMMGIFFSGRDLTNEVLAETKPEIRLVVAEQEYDPALGTPQVKLPAFALILRLRNPEQFNEVAEEAWQKAVGLINFTRGQQAMAGLIIDRPVYADTKFTFAYFSTAQIEDKTRLDQRFNLRPALAIPGEYLVLSSTDGLARDLIDVLNREGKRKLEPLAYTHSLLEIEGGRLASILEANREILVRGDMVKKGSTREDAETGIDMLITLAKCVEHIELSIGMNEGLTEARLETKLNIQ